MADLPATLLRAITWDQETETARHLTITASLGAPVSFCDARSPWQGGSNENMNLLLRDYFPKGTDPNAHSPEHLLAVDKELDNRPRLVLNDHAPAELLTALLPPAVVRVATLTKSRHAARAQFSAAVDTRPPMRHRYRPDLRWRPRQVALTSPGGARNSGRPTPDDTRAGRDSWNPGFAGGVNLIEARWIGRMVRTRPRAIGDLPQRSEGGGDLAVRF